MATRIVAWSVAGALSFTNDKTLVQIDTSGAGSENHIHREVRARIGADAARPGSWTSRGMLPSAPRTLRIWKPMAVSSTFPTTSVPCRAKPLMPRSGPHGAPTESRQGASSRRSSAT
jgi:hypothetical protein